MTQWFVSSIEDTVFDENFEVDDVPHVLRIEAYNLDDTFSHNVWVACSILRPGKSTRLSEFVDFMEKGF